MLPHTVQHFLHPHNLDHYRDAMSATLAHLTRLMANVDHPATGVDPERAAKPIYEIDLDRPVADEGAALDEVTQLWLDDTIWFHDPGYAAHLNCPIVIPALLAELLSSTVNTSMDTFDQSVGATFIERRILMWTAQRIGLPDTADGIFTSGGSQSNLHGLLLGRDRARGAGHRLDDLAVVASADAHYSVQRSAHLLGLSPDQVHAVAVDGDHQMSVTDLAQVLARLAREGRSVATIVATAGTTDFGAIDPLPEIAALADAYQSWLHVDAAYGGGLLASRQHRHRLTGIERADSVTIDFHKTWFQPVAASALIVRNETDLRQVTWHADYLNPRDSTDPNQADKSLQTTRRFDALKVWMSLRIMGVDAIGEALDTIIDLTQGLHRYLVACPELRVAARPQLSTLVFRYEPTTHDPEQVDELNHAIRRSLYAEGRYMVAETRVEGRVFLKVTLLNPLATESDLRAIVDRVRWHGADLASSWGGAA